MNSFTTEEIETYCIDHSNRPSELCNQLEIHTKENVQMSQMLIGKMEGSFLGLLIKMLGAKRILEFGTFTGYSALCMAERLPEDGELITLDINPETVDIGKSYWNQSPHGNKIKSLIGPAKESLKNLSGEFDLVFIDADKVNYKMYFDYAIEHLSSGGAIVLDNALWSGNVLKEAPKDNDTKALKEINEYVANREDLYTTLLPIRDGMHIIIKN